MMRTLSLAAITATAFGINEVIPLHNAAQPGQTMPAIGEGDSNSLY